MASLTSSASTSAKIAERSRRGKLRKACEGKVMAGHRVKYDFRLNDNRNGLLVDEDKMRIVRRIFRMVGTEGHSMNAVYKTFQSVAERHVSEARMPPCR
jgi:site-specific DNA recombinase